MLPNTATVETSYGKVEVSCSPVGLRRIAFVSEDQPLSKDIAPQVQSIVDQLNEFFEGSRQRFDIAIDYSSMPVFQADVLKLVKSIPYGKTRTYGQIARHLGNPKAARAVGQANGNNPIPIVIPCHRVIGTSGELTGYAYGLELKKRLLALENPRAYQPQMQLFA